MKIAILGYGSQGKSALDYFNSTDNEITVCDKNTSLELSEGIGAKLGDDYLENLDEFDIIVRSPSIHPREIIGANPSVTNILEKVTTNTNVFFEVCPTKNIVGVTGTKGKGTTSTLITKILEAAGHTVHLGGNIGTPPLELLRDGIEKDDWVVLELANFQLIDLRHSPHIAVCVMVEPEHQDWHANVDEYIQAKQQLFKWQKSDDIAIGYAKSALSVAISSAGKGHKIAYFSETGARVEHGAIIIDNETICKTDEIGLPGEHNWQNVCAAITATWQITKDNEAIRMAVKSLTSLPFRIEFRREVDGVKYFNDSFATAPGATIAAIDALRSPKVVILGGHDRGLDLKDLVTTIKHHEGDIRGLVLIGASADRIAENLEKAGFNNYSFERSKDMSQIVHTASKLAKPGDVVLLSPSFASFDMFKNFEERGKAFNAAVEALA